MNMNNAPWDSPKRPAGDPPPTQSQFPSQFGDLEKLMSLAEGFMERFWPRAQKFMESVQAVKEGRTVDQVKAVETDGGVVSPPPAPTPGVTAEDVYGMIFNLLNMVPDEMTCLDMRTFARDNKEAILSGIRQKLGA